MAESVPQSFPRISSVRTAEMMAVVTSSPTISNDLGMSGHPLTASTAKPWVSPRNKRSTVLAFREPGADVRRPSEWRSAGSTRYGRMSHCCMLANNPARYFLRHDTTVTTGRLPGVPRSRSIAISSTLLLGDRNTSCNRILGVASTFVAFKGRLEKKTRKGAAQMRPVVVGCDACPPGVPRREPAFRPIRRLGISRGVDGSQLREQRGRHLAHRDFVIADINAHGAVQRQSCQQRFHRAISLYSASLRWRRRVVNFA